MRNVKKHKMQLRSPYCTHCSNTDKTIPSYFAWPSKGNNNLVKCCSIGRSNKFIVFNSQKLVQMTNSPTKIISLGFVQH